MEAVITLRMAEATASTQEQELSRAFERDSVRRRQQQQAKAEPSAKSKLADKALEAISKSPAGANPWVRLVLILNNLLNRLTGKPPNSAENLTIGMQVITAVILILLLIQFLLVFSIIFFLINLIVNPGLVVQAALCQVFSSILAFFGNTACTAT